MFLVIVLLCVMITKLLLGACALTAGFASAEVERPPNIVYVMTDDQRWDTFGCYGRPEFKTTNIDKLSAEGVTFDNAHYAVAICTPSRVTVMTGRYFASHEAGFTYPYNKSVSREDFQDSYHAILKKAGYRSGFIGKYGVPVVGGGREHFDFFAQRNHYDKPKNDPVMDHIYRADRDPKERTLRKGDAMIHFLDTQPKGQPFVLSVSFDAVKNDRDDDMYGPDEAVFANQEMSVPGNWTPVNENFPDVVKNNARGVRLHKHMCSTPELYQKLARRFATQGLTVDNQVGRLIEKLEEMGVLDNTVIIYTSDNGRFHGSHGMFDKCLLYEEATKAPLIIWDGRVAPEKRGFRVNELVSSADYAPTILGLAGLEAPESMQGRDISPLLNQTVKEGEWRDAVFMENLFIEENFEAIIHKRDQAQANADMIAGNRSYRSRGIRTKKYKYFIYFEHRPVIEELYDLENDPLEQENLVNHADYQEVLAELREKTSALHQEYAAH